MTKIHIVSGFLGSGKTTLIKKLLEKLEGRTVILENEFGEVAIDGDLLRPMGHELVELSKGCICCSLKGDFEESLVEILEKYKPDHIVVEPTGIGLLSDILEVLKSERLRDLELMSPITVVDPSEYIIYLDNFGSFFQDQIENAGIVYLSKLELLEKEDLEEALKSIRSLNPRADLVFENQDDSLELLGEKPYDNRSIKYISLDQDQSLESLGLENLGDFKKEDLERVLESLIEEEEILRIKGFLKLEGQNYEVNYTKTSSKLAPTENEAEVKLSIIGRNLKKEKLVGIFN